MAQRIEIGAFNEIHCETYAECARICLRQRADDGIYSACVVDGILYIFQKTQAGDYVIIKANSTFYLNVKP